MKKFNYSLLKSAAYDLFALTGTGLIVYGVWQMHQPAAYIVGGLILLALSVFAATKHKGKHVSH